MSFLWDTLGLNLVQYTYGSVSSLVCCRCSGKCAGLAVRRSDRGWSAPSKYRLRWMATSCRRSNPRITVPEMATYATGSALAADTGRVYRYTLKEIVCC